MRIILKCDSETPRTFMLDALKWMSISQRIKYNVLVMIYKMINGLLPKYLCDNIIFPNQVHNRTTRQTNLRLPRCGTEFARKNVFVKGIAMYNALPNNLKELNSLNLFKSKCTEYVRCHYDKF